MCEFFNKICCYQPKARLVPSKFSTIVLGGTAALHAYRAWGAVLFFGDEVLPFFVLVILILLVPMLLLDYSLIRRKRPTPNIQRSMSKSVISGRISWPVAFTLVALLIAATIVVIFLRIESWPARTAHQSTAELERIGKNLRAAFIDIAHLQPRITINNRVYMEQTRPVSELVVLSRRIEVEHELLHSWVGSSKRVKLHGTFNIKAGFDLRQNLSIDIRPNEIIVQLPHAQILGIEQGQLDVLAFENGLWNRISGEDVQNELSILPQLAREKANESGLPAEAEHALRQQIEQRIHTEQPLRLIFTNGQKRE
jgi:Protein of unknown function (DUF4230)